MPVEANSANGYRLIFWQPQTLEPPPRHPSAIASIGTIVTATYRSGIGLAGLLGADRLSLLKTRPLGITSVTKSLKSDSSDKL
ncbi:MULTISPECIES: hypothetical protein [unclassified Nostoc]|uniref:hypothetical protein n=1 Tax=unclassified Nostoc TaxID=2593658 RepID=UPI002AD470E9|nr:hypothetical protein [Nostoc sp. DedQUE03]MDZ7971727.1 hypothetical protein [Nostoc sp. DedQUE03]MDZ8047303.1 hypothetical protein [Nostoc sp. DedQUE02]